MVHAWAVKFTTSGQKLSQLGPPNVVGVLLVTAQPRNTRCVLLGSLTMSHGADAPPLTKPTGRLLAAYWPRLED
jgi:hypothetical protein